MRDVSPDNAKGVRKVCFAVGAKVFCQCDGCSFENSHAKGLKALQLTKQ